LYYDFSVSSNNISTVEEKGDAALSHHWSKLSDVGEQVA